MTAICTGADWTPGSGICGACGAQTPNRWFCRGRRGDRNSCRRIWIRNHFWSDARKAAKRRDGYRCVKCGSTERLEVNHIIPLGDGSHSKTSCRHHMANLETLCHACHVKTTRRQRTEKLLQDDLFILGLRLTRSGVMPNG